MYDVNEEWTPADLALLAELKDAESRLPADAPRALLSIRLSIFTDDTTSPVRQELDLRLLAREKGHRVVGVASDLNVSATTAAPWKRKNLGMWLNDRVPEFDALFFWKIDRFIRTLNDLNVMIRWTETYGKNLVSKMDPIDLSTTVGRTTVQFLGAMAEIEAVNTKTRVESLWKYAKTQTDWLVGKPPYGYMSGREEAGRAVLVIDPAERDVLHLARTMIVDGDKSTRTVVNELKARKLVTAGLTPSTMLRRLRNPALLGYRVEEDKQGGLRRSKLVLGHDGKPIQVAKPIFTEEEFETLQAKLNSRGKNQPPRQPSGATKLLGDFPVQTREYARGEAKRKEAKRLEEAITYYMKGLEPGGRYTKTRFTQKQAEQTLDHLITELNAIEPDSMRDRWVHVADGKTFRQRWEEGGMDAMRHDLLRAGIRCQVTRTKIPRVRAPKVHLKLTIPKDVRQRLTIKASDFGDAIRCNATSPLPLPD